MDFFTAQDRARKETVKLLFLFGLAVAAVTTVIYLVAHYFLELYAEDMASRLNESYQFSWWDTEHFLVITSCTLIIILGATFSKIQSLRSGGGRAIAEMLNGREIPSAPTDFFEKRLRNVVEEMAISAGIAVPSIYVLEQESGINAFAAGYDIQCAVIAVTYGAMTGLKREELQGVVAHEVSHILNNDMRLNISLMGIVHGLLIIGLTGRVLFRFSASDIRNTSSFRQDSKPYIILPLVVFSLIMIIVGSIGVFFTRLIKAAISRSRERLADASAVQFTRNPIGLADALKKIGGLADGSRISNPNAEQASHMFFGSGARSSLFDTHPPLIKRIRWLQPNYDGSFAFFSLEQLQQKLKQAEGAPEVKKRDTDVVDLLTNPARLATGAAILDSAHGSRRPAPAKPQTPEKLLASIGAPMEEHAQRAQELIASIPEELKEQARDPFGAQAIIYTLLLDSDTTIFQKQLIYLKQEVDEQMYRLIEQHALSCASLVPAQRLPLIDLTMASIRFITPSQYEAFRAHIKKLIDADHKISIFEYTIHRLLLRHLDPHFRSMKKSPVQYYSIRGLQDETSIIISVLSRVGHKTNQEIEAAFVAATAAIAEPKAEFSLRPKSDCNWKSFDQALNRLNEGSFKVRRWVLVAALVCLMHDNEITIEEVELFRAIADSLGCPVPPWVTVCEIETPKS